MRSGRPVNQRNYALQYNPIIGRKSIVESIGLFKNTARYLGLGATLGYDPKGQSSVGVHQPVLKSFEGIRKIGEFLKHFNNKKPNTFSITQENGVNYITIGNGIGAKHSFRKSGDYYYLMTKRKYNNSKIPESRNKNIEIKIKAADDSGFKEKLSWILANPISRAKLDYQESQINPFEKGTIYFNERKIIGHVQLQEFNTIGDPALAEAFDTDIGSMDPSAINYYVRTRAYQGYSALTSPASNNLHDQYADRVHGMNEHMLSSNHVDELLGNIVNMFHSDKNLSAENRAQIVNNMRQDFVFNLYGKGSRNGHGRDEGKDTFASPSKFQSFVDQLLFATNPQRGGRYWRNLPPSLTQTMDLMYHASGNGALKHQYDENPEKYLKKMRKLKITIADKQFMPAYGRKILAIYLALKFIKEDLSHIKIDSPTVSKKDIQKWKDLTLLHDELFESTGDLKDFLRHNTSGFAQVAESVKPTNNIPNIKETTSINTDNGISVDIYANTAKKTLYPLMLNYTQFQNFMGWRTKDKGSSILYEAFKHNVFEREVPDIVAGAATVMMLDGLDKISRRLKFIDETIGRDAKLKGVTDQIINKTKQGDIEGAYDMITRQGQRLTSFLNYETLFSNPRLHGLLTEGDLWNKEIFKPLVRDYQAENNNFFVGNHLVNNIVEKNGKILTAKLIEAIKMQARLIKNIHLEMKEKNIPSPYETQALFTLSSYMRKAAKEIAVQFMHDHKSYFVAISNEETERIFRDVLKETYGLQELIGNVAGILATGKEQTYGFGVNINERDKKRNQRLAKLSGHTS